MGLSRSHYLATVAIVSNDLNLLCAGFSLIEYHASGWTWGWVTLAVAFGLYVCGIIMAKMGDNELTTAHQLMLHYAEMKLLDLYRKTELEMESQAKRSVVRCAEEARSCTGKEPTRGTSSSPHLLHGSDAAVAVAAESPPHKSAESPPQKLRGDSDGLRRLPLAVMRADTRLELGRALADARKFRDEYQFMLNGTSASRSRRTLWAALRHGPGNSYSSRVGSGGKSSGSQLRGRDGGSGDGSGAAGKASGEANAGGVASAVEAATSTVGYLATQSYLSRFDRSIAAGEQVHAHTQTHTHTHTHTRTRMYAYLVSFHRPIAAADCFGSLRSRNTHAYIVHIGAQAI